MKTILITIAWLILNSIIAYSQPNNCNIPKTDYKFIQEEVKGQSDIYYRKLEDILNRTKPSFDYLEQSEFENLTVEAEKYNAKLSREIRCFKDSVDNYNRVYQDISKNSFYDELACLQQFKLHSRV